MSLIETLEALALKLPEESGIKDAIDEAKKAQKTYSDTISDLERDRNSAIEKRDAQKRLVRDTLGIEEITPESLSTAINGLRENADESLRAELSKLNDIVSSKDDDITKLKSEIEQVGLRQQVQKELASLGVLGDLSEGAKVQELLMAEVMNGLKQDGDFLGYTEKDGSTRRLEDGSPMSIKDRVESLRSEEMPFLFKQRRNKAGGDNNASGSRKPDGTIAKLSDMSDKERITLYKQNPEHFAKLAEMEKQPTYNKE